MMGGMSQKAEKSFFQRKIYILDSLYSSQESGKKKDDSKKGSVDEKCIPIMAELNNFRRESDAFYGENKDSRGLGDYITTSSCSGRILIWKGGGKSEGEWTFCSHDKISLSSKEEFALLFSQIMERKKLDSSESLPLGMISDERLLVESLGSLLKESKNTEESHAYFKMEPFLMHIQCKDLKSAQNLLEIALASGYRNSGLVVGNKRIICCIRDCAGFQNLISANSRAYFTWEYIYELIRISNAAMQRNFDKMDRFLARLQSSLVR